MGRKYTLDDISDWNIYVEQNGSIKSAAKHFGVPYTSIRPYTTEALGRFKKERDRERASAPVRLGGLRTEAAKEKCKKTWRNKAESKYAIMLSEAGLEYIGGYTDSDGTVTVKCRTCHRAFEIACQRIRKGHAKCDLCEADKAEEEKRKRKEAEKEERKAKHLRKVKEQEAERIAKRNRVCKECGLPFVSSHNAYCSDQCRKKADNRRRDAKRRGYKSSVSITELYKRDRGICYICGCVCDYEDFSVAGGAFIVGPTYPTVEHVIPVSKGGPDSWDNVRLACHRCNTRKSINSFLKIEGTGQVSIIL